MKTPQRTVTLALVLALGGLLALGASSKAGRDVSESEVTSLKSQVTSLENKITELEKRLQTLERKGSAFFLQPHTQPGASSPPVLSHPAITTPPALSPGRSPEIWGRGECNGWTYYIVPVNQPLNSNR